MAGSQAPVVTSVRLLNTGDEFAEAVRLQRVIWGFDDLDLLPVRLFVVASKIGGHVLGAFDGERMAGFCLGIPGIKPGPVAYIHGHMLGVLPEYRNAGVGRALKLAQREQALAQGIDLIEWTFDPLELKNAWFNIERLGAVIRRYVFNQYGVTSSRLHGGLPTDRCVAEWHVTSLRVEQILAGKPPAKPPVEARIAVPASIAELRADRPAEAREIQKRIGEEFQRHLSAGLAVVGLARSAGAVEYLLGRLD